MALHVRFEARLDRLAHALIDQLAVPAGGPLTEDVVIVPSLGEARWLQQRVAQRLGVSAGWRPEFAGRYLWRLLAEVFPELPAHSPFDPDLSRWTLMSLLGELPGQDDPPLRQRLAGRAAGGPVRAGGRYRGPLRSLPAYRRDWLARWQAGQWAAGGEPLSPHEGWQRWLWNALLARLPGISTVHPTTGCWRPSAPIRWRWAAPAGPPGDAVRFGRDVARTVSRSGCSPMRSTCVFAPDPCREFWHDMVTPRARAEVALCGPTRPGCRRPAGRAGALGARAARLRRAGHESGRTMRRGDR
jgi:exodeoxyribonuclease V gamma subunit